MELTTIQEIKDAVDAGKNVKCDSNAYNVIKDRVGQYLIVCLINDYTIALHGLAGTKYENVLNGTTFYTV